MANTPIYGWETPDDTDYVYQGAAAIRTTANAIDSTLSSQIAGTGYGVKSYVLDTTSTIIIASTGIATLFTAPSFTPVAGRLYQVTFSVGNIGKRTNAGIIFVTLQMGTGTILDRGYIEGMAVNDSTYFSKTIVLTSAQMGTSAFIPTVRIQPSTNGCIADNSSTGGNGTILITDIGAA